MATCSAGARANDLTPLGVGDLSGNVAEWVFDEAAGHEGAPWMVLRGGSFSDEARWLQSTARRAAPAVTAHVTLGVRCAKDL